MVAPKVELQAPPVTPLLRLSTSIDRLTTGIGKGVSWLILISILISAGNAIVRKLFGLSSNAWLEIQWWLFATSFLFAAPWTLLLGEHIRIDILEEKLSPKARNTIALLGHTAFLMPVAAIILVTSWTTFLTSWNQDEQALNPGGLPQWPIKAVIPVAAALLLLQGISEIIKSLAARAELGAKPGSAPGTRIGGGGSLPDGL